MPGTPITETSHSITANIDISHPQGIIRQVHQCDREIFHGWQTSQGLYDVGTLEAIDDLVQMVADFIKNRDDNLIVLSGCGTSGRLGFIATRDFNARVEGALGPGTSCMDYLIAGGDLAFFTSQEIAEDKPQRGVDDLKRVCAGKRKVLLIGISCGLSAPYVAGQVDYALEHPETFIPCVLGFNPVNLARDIRIENWNKSFHEVAERLVEAHNQKKGFLLNPTVGPEPITGSSRMKGGSCTKILLDIIFTAAIARSQGKTWPILPVLKAYEEVQTTTYSHVQQISQLIQRAGHSLNHDGHVYYLGENQLGLFGLLDASECPPTYGADFEDVRGFLLGGYLSLHNKEGDISQQVPLSVDYFLKEKLSGLTELDTVIILAYEGLPRTPQKLAASPAQTVLVNFTSQTDASYCDPVAKTTVNIELPHEAVSRILGDDVSRDLWAHLVEISCKWLLNLVSTAAYIHIGKVYQNYMIDLKVSNNKLYHRAIAMIQKLTGATESDAESALLRSIYDRDQLDYTIYEAPLGQHIQNATHKHRVVPVAMILAVTHNSVVQAHAMISESAVIRVAITKCCHNNETLW